MITILLGRITLVLCFYFSAEWLEDRAEVYERNRHNKTSIVLLCMSLAVSVCNAVMFGVLVAHAMQMAF